MNNIFEAFVQFSGIVGAFFLGLCLLTGGYIWLRWGAAGAAIIWSKRRDLDEEVRAITVAAWRRQ